MKVYVCNVGSLGKVEGRSNDKVVVAHNNVGGKRKMIPVKMISEALGCKYLKTTQIYLDSFDNEDLDAANERIVG